MAEKVVYSIKIEKPRYQVRGPLGNEEERTWAVFDVLDAAEDHAGSLAELHRGETFWVVDTRAK